MLLPEIAEELIRLDSGGIFTDENKNDDLFIYSLVHQYRANAIKEYYFKNRRTQSVWIQQYYPEYLSARQESSEYKLYECPPVITIDNKRDGFVYVGTLDSHCRYRQSKTRGDLETALRNRITANSDRFLYAGGFLEVYSKSKEIRVDAIFSNPTDLETFNIEKDDYPISDDILVVMKSHILQTQFLPMGKPIDNISDSQSKVKQ